MDSGKTARILTGIMIGLNAFYAFLIYKVGQGDGEMRALDHVREDLEDVAGRFGVKVER